MSRLYSKIGKFWSFSKTSFIRSASTPPISLVVIVLHSLIRSDLDIAYDQTVKQNTKFNKFWSFSKTSYILSASTPQISLVVIVLLGIYPSYVWYTAGVTFPNKVRF